MLTAARLTDLFEKFYALNTKVGGQDTYIAFAHIVHTTTPK